MNDEIVPWPPTFFELGSGEYMPAQRFKGQHSWYIRGQNFVTVVSQAGSGEVLLEEPAPDEHLVLVLEGAEVEVHGGGGRASVVGPALVVVPTGPSQVTVHKPGDIVRVFTTRSPVTSKAVNAATYATPNPRVSLLSTLAASEGFGILRVFPLADVPETPGGPGRVYRSGSLMVNWIAPDDGPSDTSALTSSVHDDFEQATLTLQGDFVHHVRRPWTRRLDDWRPDEHVQVTSPSVTLIPPGNIHASRWVNKGRHQLIDVFAPPRSDFIEHGWVLNQSEYESVAGES